jgi:hypothetical protein
MWLVELARFSSRRKPKGENEMAKKGERKKAMKKFFRSWVGDALRLSLALVALAACGSAIAATTMLCADYCGSGTPLSLAPSPQTVLIIIQDEDDCSMSHCA